MSDPNFSTASDAPAYAPTPAPADGPTMSTPETLSSIFFEPGRTFEALRHRPRFLVAALILVALTLFVTILLFQKVSFEQVVREAIEKSPQMEQMSPEEKEGVITMQTGVFGKTLAYVGPFIGTAVILAAGAALYLLGVMMMGGKISYKQALSVYTYSSLPPAVLGSIVAILLIFLKEADEFDFQKSGAGLVVTNPGAFLGPGTSPILRAALSWFDLFTFFGMFLAALGLRKVGKLSSAGAWGIVIGLWFLGMLFSVGRAAIFGG